MATREAVYEHFGPASQMLEWDMGMRCSLSTRSSPKAP